MQGSLPSLRVSLQPGLELAALEELGGSTYAGITITLEPQQRAGRDWGPGGSQVGAEKPSAAQQPEKHQHQKKSCSHQKKPAVALAGMGLSLHSSPPRTENPLQQHSKDLQPP